MSRLNLTHGRWQIFLLTEVMGRESLAGIIRMRGEITAEAGEACYADEDRA
jgi:hypothetical protein